MHRAGDAKGATVELRIPGIDFCDGPRHSSHCFRVHRALDMDIRITERANKPLCSLGGREDQILLCLRRRSIVRTTADRWVVWIVGDAAHHSPPFSVDSGEPRNVNSSE
jgi:hypothetical protein